MAIRKNINLIFSFVLGFVLIAVFVCGSCGTVYGAQEKLSSISFAPGSSTEYGYWESGGKSNTGFRFSDGTDKAIFKIPIDANARELAKFAKISVLVDQNYTIEGKADDGEWEMFAKAPGGEGVGEFSIPQMKIVIDILEAVKAGAEYYYIRIGDQTENNGWGGRVHNITLAYADIKGSEVEPATEKVPFSFTATSKKEMAYWVSGGGQKHDTERMRFMDGNNTVVYRLPYDSSKDATVKMEMRGNYIVWLSKDGKNWGDAVLSEPSGKDAQEVDGNHGIYEINLTDAGYKGEEIDFVYIKIGDQTTKDGWGGCLYYLEMVYDSESKNPLAYIDGVAINANDNLEVAKAIVPGNGFTDEIGIRTIIYILTGVVTLILLAGAIVKYRKTR